MRNLQLSDDGNGMACLYRHSGDITPVTLPPDAAPGMWAVRLAVHQ